MEKFIRPPKPDWFDENVPLSKEDEEKVMVLLSRANAFHCAYSDKRFTTDSPVLDKFDPNRNDWDNYFPVLTILSQLKSKKYSSLLLKPDEADYDFDKYFIIDIQSGLLHSNPKSNQKNQERANETIEFLSLNAPFLVEERKLKSQGFEKKFLWYLPTTDDNKYNGRSYRFMLKKIVQDLSNNIKKGFIHSVSIENFHCIQNVTVENLGNSKEIYFLGENGDGKTLLLQALVLLFKRSYLQNNADISDVAESYEMLKDLIGSKSFYKNEEKEESVNGGWLEDLYAYGVSRNQSNGESDKYGFLTLFDKRKILKSPTEWLLELKLEEIEKDYKGIKSLEAIALLENLTDHNLIISIKGSKVNFNERGFDIAFEKLSEGYRSVLIWVADLVSRLSRSQPDFKTISYKDGTAGYDFEGVVLVDEINLHLHPKWEYQIVRKLRRWFPKIQFFFTTHSPMTVMGASDDAVFYKLYKESGITKISEPYFAEEMDNWLANVLITSPLFDMESARTAFFDESEGADTAEDSLTSQIRKSVKEEMKKLKKESRKAHFSRAEIQSLIQKAIQKAQSEA